VGTLTCQMVRGLVSGVGGFKMSDEPMFDCNSDDPKKHWLVHFRGRPAYYCRLCGRTFPCEKDCFWCSPDTGCLDVPTAPFGD
jgi:hypothetical protein